MRKERVNTRLDLLLAKVKFTRKGCRRCLLKWGHIGWLFRSRCDACSEYATLVTITPKEWHAIAVCDTCDGVYGTIVSLEAELLAHH